MLSVNSNKHNMALRPNTNVTDEQQVELRDHTLLIWTLFNTITIKQVITGMLPTQYKMIMVHFQRYLTSKNLTDAFLFAAAELLTQKMHFIKKLMDKDGNIEKISLKRVLPQFTMSYATGYYQIDEEYGDVIQVDCEKDHKIVQSFDYQIPWQLTCKIEDEWTAEMMILNKDLPRPTEKLGFIDEIASFFFWSQVQIESIAEGLKRDESEDEEKEQPSKNQYTPSATQTVNTNNLNI